MGCYCSACDNPPCGHCESTGQCERCDEEFDNNDLEDVNGEILCEDCANNTMCNRCDCGIPNEDILEYDGGDFCEDCVNEIKKEKLSIKLYGHI
jgi:formylmethanofuran dehydrogenase subunit E